MKKTLVLSALALLAAMLLALTGCSGAGQTAAAPTAAPAPETGEEEPAQDSPAEEPAQTEEAPEEEEELAVIGDPDAGGWEIPMVNATGTDITAVNIRPSAAVDGAYALLLSEGDTFAADETRLLCYAPGEEGDGTAYDLQIAWANWTMGELLGIDLSDVGQAQLCRTESGQPYLVYTSVSTGETVDTSTLEGFDAAAPAQEEGANDEGCIDDALFN